MRQEWEPEDLIEVWTLLEEDQERLRNKSGANRLGFALLLKFFEVEARFPEDAGEIPVPAVSYVAQQVKVPAEEWATYDWSGRAIKRHRMEIRGAFGFRECTEEDQGQLAEWLAVELCGVELNRERLAEAVVARCRKDRLEPPAPGQIARLVGRAVSTFEERFCATTVGRLSAATGSRLDELIAEDVGADEESAGGGGTFFTELKADPGALGLDSLLAEVNKLQRVRGLQLPPELFGDVSGKLVAAWRARARRSTSRSRRSSAISARAAANWARSTSGSSSSGRYPGASIRSYRGRYCSQPGHVTVAFISGPGCVGAPQIAVLVPHPWNSGSHWYTDRWIRSGWPARFRRATGTRYRRPRSSAVSTSVMLWSPWSRASPGHGLARASCRAPETGWGRRPNRAGAVQARPVADLPPCRDVPVAWVVRIAPQDRAVVGAHVADRGRLQPPRLGLGDVELPEAGRDGAHAEGRALLLPPTESVHRSISVGQPHGPRVLPSRPLLSESLRAGLLRHGLGQVLAQSLSGLRDSLYGHAACSFVFQVSGPGMVTTRRP